MAEALTLARFLVGESRGADPALVQRRRERMRVLQQELQDCAHPICRAPRPVEEIPVAVRQAFMQAALLVSRYFSVGGVGWRGTLTSPTLAKYEADPIPPTWYTPAGIMALGDRFALSSAAMDQMVHDLAQVDEEIAQQRQLLEAMLDSVGLALSTPDPLPPEPFVLLFEHLFNGILINPEKLSVIFTPTQLYFCIDFPPLEDIRAWKELAVPEYQGALRELHQQLSTFTFQKFKRFPTFGPCDPVGIDRPWVERVCDRLNQTTPQLFPINPEAVIQRLSKSIGVLPLKDAEMFLIHDIWGHYWQLWFSQFDSDYSTLADCGAPLRAQETAYTAEGPLTCRELFQFQGAEVKLDQERAQQFFHAEVRQRLGLLFTHLLGELVADIAEFKFTWTNPSAAHELPSSSAFTDYPANLDLSLADLDFLFLRVLQPLLEVHLSPLEPCPLELELLAHSPVQYLPLDQVPKLEVNLKRAIAKLYIYFLDAYNSHYLPTLADENSLFAEVAVNLLQLQNVINILYTDPQFAQSPIPFQDLLVVFISCYCSGDSYAEFWTVDNVLADYFIPCWWQLHAATGQ
jgi:hypothetical protein